MIPLPATGAPLIETFRLIAAHTEAHSAHANQLVTLAAHLYHGQAIQDHWAPVAYHVRWIPAPRARRCGTSRSMFFVERSMFFVESSGIWWVGHAPQAALPAVNAAAIALAGRTTLGRVTSCAWLPDWVGYHPHRLVMHRPHLLVMQRPRRLAPAVPVAHWMRNDGTIAGHWT